MGRLFLRETGTMVPWPFDTEARKRGQIVENVSNQQKNDAILAPLAIIRQLPNIEELASVCPVCLIDGWFDIEETASQVEQLLFDEMVSH